MALMSWKALGRRNVAGPLLLLNLVLYVFMMGFASWALNSFVHGGHHKQQQQQQQQYYYYYSPRSFAIEFHIDGILTDRAGN
jgi:hypothetical protein